MGPMEEATRNMFKLADELSAESGLPRESARFPLGFILALAETYEEERQDGAVEVSEEVAQDYLDAFIAIIGEHAVYTAGRFQGD